MAAQLGLDTAAFGDCLGSGKYTAQVEADYAETGRVGVTGTPTFFINGMAYPGKNSAVNPALPITRPHRSRCRYRRLGAGADSRQWALGRDGAAVRR